MITRIRLMKVSRIAGALVVATVLQVGCHWTTQTQAPTRPYPVYVGSAPPETRVETRSSQPDDERVWVAGYWHWSEADAVWQWRPGHWVLAPIKGSSLVEATYEQRGDVWVYTAPYWKAAGEPAAPMPYSKTEAKASDSQSPTAEDRADVAATEPDHSPASEEMTPRSDESQADPAALDVEAEKKMRSDTGDEPDNRE